MILSDNHWNDTHPTTSVFSVGGYTDHADLTSPSTKIVVFANVEGHCKVGLYKMVEVNLYTQDLKPAFVLEKRTNVSP